MITPLDFRNFWTKVTRLFSLNSRGIVVDHILVRFWIPLSVPEIFTIKLWSRPKWGQILHVFGPWNYFFWGGGSPEILGWHYKIRPSIDHCAKFCTNWPTHLGDLAWNKKQASAV